MTPFRRNSFVTGFACAFLLMAMYFLWHNAPFEGGVHADSPDDAYSFLAMAPMSPKHGGEYVMRLLHKKSGRLIRHATVTVPFLDQTVGLREGGGAIHWDVGSTFVDLHVDGQPAFRMWVP